jgi:hypothetical protein
MVKKKLLDFFPPMNGSPIPQQEDWSPKMPEEILEEGSDIQAREIPGAKLDIKGQALSFRGNRQRTDRRNSVLLVGMVKERRLPFRSPGAGNRWKFKKTSRLDTLPG